MKVEFDFLRRAYAANMHRRRALEIRSIASDRTMSAVRKELEDEAAWNEEQARKLDDCEEQSEKPAATPTRADPRLDIDSIDAPKPQP
jgi:hypothetical protein